MTSTSAIMATTTESSSQFPSTSMMSTSVYTATTTTNFSAAILSTPIAHNFTYTATTTLPRRKSDKIKLKRLKDREHKYKQRQLQENVEHTRARDKKGKAKKGTLLFERPQKQRYDQKRKASARSDPEKRASEQQYDQKRKASARSDPGKRAREQVKDRTYRSITRSDPEIKAREQQYDQKRKASARSDPEKRAREQTSDRTQRAIKRSNMDVRTRERKIDRQRKAKPTENLPFTFSKGTYNRQYHREKGAPKHKSTRCTEDIEHELGVNMAKRQRRSDEKPTQTESAGPSKPRAISHTLSRQEIEQLLVSNEAEHDLEIPQNSASDTEEDGEQRQEEIQKQTILYEQQIKEGPTCVCTCCGNLWFKKSVIPYNEQDLLRFHTQRDLNTHCGHLQHPQNKHWLCYTCHKTLKQKMIPRLSLANGLAFPELPPELLQLTPLEERLVSPRIPFMQIRALGVDRQQGLKGNVVNVPVEVSANVSILPRPVSDSQTIQLKLMRKMSYRGHYLFETIRPRAVYDAARVLVGTPLYQKHGVTTLADDWLSQHSTNEESFIVLDEDRAQHELQESPVIPTNDNAREQDTRIPERDHAPNIESNNASVGAEEEWDETNDEPVNPGADETLIDYDHAIKFAPGQGQRPLSVLLDEDCEELAFPTIFAGQRRAVPPKVSYSDVAKSEARRYDRRATKVPKLFFSFKKMEMLRLSSAVQICLRKKKHDKAYTARDILQQSTVNDIINTDQGYRVLTSVRGSPPFWEAKKKELLAMVRQLGCPTFFFTLSAAETKWVELLRVLFAISERRLPEPEEEAQWTFMQKADLIRADPVTCARYFDHRFRALFNNIIRCQHGPLGEVLDFFWRVEFQHRGSPHIHGLLWVKDAPVFDPEDADSAARVAAFIDKHITCNKPQEGEDLHDEVLLQQHKHSHTCLKQCGKEKKCRFGIPKYPMSSTTILKPIASTEICPLPEDFMKQKVTEIQECLKASAEALTFPAFLEELGLTEGQYLLCIRSTLKRPQIFLKRDVSETRSNAYNPQLLRLWQANMDIQFVLDAYACVMYIVNYVSKSQRGMSALLRTAVTEARKGNTTIRDRLRAVANCFLNCSELSAQEAVYHLLGMPVCQASRSCQFINTSRPEKRTKMVKSDEMLQKMDPKSTDVMCSNDVDRYTSRPHSMEDMCLSTFIANHNINNKGRQPPAHDDEDADEDRQTTKDNIIELNDGQGYVTKRKRAKIIRYCNFDILKDETDFYREQLMLFHPWRNEENDLINIDHKEKYKQHKITILEKRQEFVSDSDDMVREAVQLMEAEADNEEALDGVVPIADLDEEPRPEQDEFAALEDPQNRQIDILQQAGRSEQAEVERFLTPGRLPDAEFEDLLSSLNDTQMKYVNHVVHAFKTGKQLPLYEFVSGGAGVGKSRLIKVLFQSLIRYFSSLPGANPDDLLVLLCAPTGKAAFNIGGMTLHSALSLPLSQYGGVLPKLGADVANTLATKLHPLKLLVIDEISMVGAKMLGNVSVRLGQIFRSSEPFGGISVIAVGDFHQLPPVADRFPFQGVRGQQAQHAELAHSLLWEKFRMLELTEIMRQKDDLQFACALSHLAVGDLSEDEVRLFQERQVLPNTNQSITHLFASNDQVDQFNDEALNKLASPNILSNAKDTCQGDASDAVKNSFKTYVKGLSARDTYGLPSVLRLKVSARYMLTINVNVTDGLVNGAIGTLMMTQTARQNDVNQPFRVWILFDDPNVGHIARGDHADVVRQLNIPPNWTPVDPISRVARRKQGGGNLQVLRSQFPLVPAMAITIHKSQGDTYSKVAVHLSRSMKRAALYVACSRAKSAAGLYLIGQFKPPAKPRPDDSVEVEMARLREERPVQPCLTFVDMQRGPGLCLSYHNVQSLPKHHRTTCADKSFMAADVLCFVETKISSQHSPIPLPGFQVVFHQGCTKIPAVYGMSVYCQPELRCSLISYDEVKSPSHVEVATLSVEKGEEKTIVILVYSSPKATQRHLFSVLSRALQTAQHYGQRLLCLGDFNIDRLKPEGNALLAFMRVRSLEPLLAHNIVTTNQGTQIDQGYSNIEGATCGTGESMTSYHKPLWVML